MVSLDDFAVKVAESFSKDYRTVRNPNGKKAIIIYGGDGDTREIFSYLVRMALPCWIDAFVSGQENKMNPRERDPNPDFLYADFGARCLDRKRD